MAKPELSSVLIELLKSGQPAMVPASGISMYPLLHPGDSLLVKPKTPEIGDIVVFLSENGQLIAHRLIHQTHSLYICKGDSLLIPDHPVSKHQILGIVTGRKRKKRTVLNSRIDFRFLHKIMPAHHNILARPFNIYARLHNKLRHLF